MNSPSRSWARPVWCAVGLLLAYYAFPVGWGDSLGWVVLSLLLTAGGLGLLGVTMIKEVESLRQGRENPVDSRQDARLGWVVDSLEDARLGWLILVRLR